MTTSLSCFVSGPSVLYVCQKVMVACLPPPQSAAPLGLAAALLAAGGALDPVALLALGDG